MKYKDLHVMVGIPVLDNVSWEFFLTTTVLVSRLAKEVKRVDLCAPNRISIDRARQIVVNTAVVNGADRIFFVDDDTIVPLDSIKTLEETMDSKPDAVAVSGICYQRGFPFHPMIYKYEDFDWGKGKLSNQLIAPFPQEPFRISASGMGICLLNVHKMKEIEGDCFGRESGGTEDFFFYKKAEEKKMEAWCDPSVEATHLGERTKITPDVAQELRAKADAHRTHGMGDILAKAIPEAPDPGQLIQYVPDESGGRGRVIKIDEIGKDEKESAA